MSKPLRVPKIAFIRRTTSGYLHYWLRRNKYEPEDVAALPAELRDAIWHKLDNPPGKKAEIARLMEKED